jgi:hypothetical protein
MAIVFVTGVRRFALVLGISGFVLCTPSLAVIVTAYTVYAMIGANVGAALVLGAAYLWRRGSA